MLGGILNEYHPAHLQHAMKTCHLEAEGGGRPKAVPKVARTIGSVLRQCGAPPVIDY